MLTVYGRANSSNVQAVMWTIGELDLPHERLDRGHSFGGLDAPEFLAMNPHGRIPVLVDGDDPPLWEASAIVRYLAARYGRGRLWIDDSAKRARVEMWADWGKFTFGLQFGGAVFWPIIRTPPAERNAAEIGVAVAQTAALAAKAEARLAASHYFSGEDFGLADIFFGHLLYRYFTLEIDRPDLPALAAYYERLTGRPAYREHVMVPYDALRAA